MVAASLILIMAAIVPAIIASAEEAILLGFPVGDVAVVSMNDKVYPVRLMGIAVSDSSTFSKVSSNKGSAARLSAFLERTVKIGEKIQLEFCAEREDRLLEGYLAAYVWLQDGRMLNEEIIKAGLASPLNEGKYFERLHRASMP